MGYDWNRYDFGVQAELEVAGIMRGPTVVAVRSPLLSLCRFAKALRGLSAFSLLEPYQTIPGLVISLFTALATVLIDVRVVRTILGLGSGFPLF